MHPYEELEKHKGWKIIKKALRDLEKNKDVIINTAPEYIVGYLLKSLKDEELINKFKNQYPEFKKK